jgi:hypothetical protein
MRVDIENIKILDAFNKYLKTLYVNQVCLSYNGSNYRIPNNIVNRFKESGFNFVYDMIKILDMVDIVKYEKLDSTDGLIPIDFYGVKMLYTLKVALNSTKLEDIEFYENGELLEIDLKLIEEFDLQGLSNWWFITTGYYKSGSKGGIET